MAEYEDNLDKLEQSLSDIELSLASTETVSRAFRSEIESVSASMTSASRQASGLSRSLGSSFNTAFSSLILGGEKMKDVLRSLGQSIIQKTFTSAMTPLSNSLGNALTTGAEGLFSSLFKFQNGGAFSTGRVRAFANGGIVDGPTPFPMRGATGLMGEAGPEAIMPLTRGTDGKLGVRSEGGRAVSVSVNVTSPDAASFKRSRSQIAAQMSRAISRGHRNL